jgi:hypothetical protein
MHPDELGMLYAALQQSLLNQAMLLRLTAGSSDETVNMAVETSKKLSTKLGKWAEYEHNKTEKHVQHFENPF